MARKKKTPAKDSGERQRIWGLSRWSGDSSRLEGLKVLAQRLFLVAFLAFLTWASLQVKMQVENDPRYRVENWTLHFGDFPEWVSPEIQAEIEASCQEGLVLTGADAESLPPVSLNPGTGDTSADGRSSSDSQPLLQQLSPPLSPLAAQSPIVFREGLFDHIRAALLSHPWVRSVPSIRLRYPGIGHDDAAGGLEVDLELKRPIALVQYKGQYYLTDYEARRLGAPIDRPFDHYRLPVIVGSERFQQGPAPASGEVWKTREILEGLAVAWQLFRADIAARYPDVPVEKISIDNVGGILKAKEPEILLVIRYGNRHLPPVGWGRSPISRGARAVDLPDKLRNLEKLLGDPEAYAEYMVRLDTSRMVGVLLH